MDKFLECISPDRRQYITNNTDEQNRELIKIVRGNDPEDKKVTLIEELVENGADVNFGDRGEQNNTPLHIAVEKEEIHVIEWLLRNGANTENKNEKGHSSWDVAKRKNNQDIIFILGEHNIKELEQKEKYFVENFVLFYERVLSEYYTRLENRSTKPGKWADLFNKFVGITSGASECAEVAGQKASLLVGISFLQNAITSIHSAHNRREMKKLTRQLFLFKTDPERVRKILIESGLCIFQKFESQFSKVTKDGSWQRAMIKLAEDAVFRIISHQRSRSDDDFSPTFLTKGVVFGQSKKYKHASTDIPHRKPGHTLQQGSRVWNTSEFFSNVGLLKKNDAAPRKYYKLISKDGSKKYGYRLLFTWELEEVFEKRGYCAVNDTQVYQYLLNEDRNENLITELYDAINNSDPMSLQARIMEVVSRLEEDAEKNCSKIESIISKNYNELFKFFEENQNQIKTDLANLFHHMETTRNEDERRHQEVRQGLLHVAEETAKIQKDIGNISAKLENNKQLRKAKWFNVRLSVTSFTGRDKQLNEIHDQIQKGKIVVICGLGGAGKSELSVKYARDKYNEKDSVIWIEAETQETVKESFRKLAKSLNIPYTIQDGSEVKPRNLADVVKDVYDYFIGTKCLFIFDNAEKYNNIEMFLPFFQRPGQNELNVLITSRKRGWRFEAREVEIVELSQFTPLEAEEFITKTLRTQDNLKDISKLGEDLQHFPLALKQATAYINFRNEDIELTGAKEFTVKDYLIEYEMEASKLLNFQSNENEWSYDKAVITTWKISTDKISKDTQNGENAINILNIMAYLTPDRLEIWDVFSNFLSDKTVFDKAVLLLHQHSIITMCKGVSNIHRLVQQVTRINLSQKCQQLEVMTNALKLFNDNITSSNVDNCIYLWNHIHSDVNLLGTDGSENKNVMLDKFKKLVKRFSKIPSQIINKMNDDIRFEEAYSFGLNMSSLLKCILGDDDSDTLQLQYNIAGVLFKQGRYDEAYREYDDVLQKQEKLINKNQNDILCTKLGKANVVYRQGKYDDALKFYKEVLDQGTEDNDMILSTMRSIAVVLNNKGEYEEALKICNTIVNKKVERLDHDALSARHEKARALDNLGRYREAKDMYLETLDAQEKILGPHHYTTLYTMHGLGRALSNQGEYKESLNIYEQLLAKRKKFGEDNPDYLATLNNIAVVHNKLGNYTQAMNLYEEVLEKRLAILGPCHPSTLYTLHGMAKVLNNQKQYEKAFEQFQDVLKKRIEKLGPDQPATLSTRHEIGVVLYNQGYYESAIEKLNDVYERRKIHLREKHPSTLSTEHAIAEVIEKTGLTDEAMKIFVAVYEDRRVQLGDEHPCTVATKCCIANVLRKKGEYKKALEMFRDVLRNYVKNFGETHPSASEVRKSIEKLEKICSSSLASKGPIALDVTTSKSNLLEETVDQKILERHEYISKAKCEIPDKNHARSTSITDMDKNKYGPVKHQKKEEKRAKKSKIIVEVQK